MKDWMPSEDVWTRHARSSRDCSLVRAEKGPEYAEQVIATHGPYVSPSPPIVVEVRVYKLILSRRLCSVYSCMECGERPLMARW